MYAELRGTGAFIVNIGVQIAVKNSLQERVENDE